LAHPHRRVVTGRIPARRAGHPVVGAGRYRPDARDHPVGAVYAGRVGVVVLPDAAGSRHSVRHGGRPVLRAGRGTARGGAAAAGPDATAGGGAVMTARIGVPRTDLDRAAVVLGFVSLVGAAVGRLEGTFGFVHLGRHGYLVALIGGVVAVVAGWLGQRIL